MNLKLIFQNHNQMLKRKFFFFLLLEASEQAL